MTNRFSTITQFMTRYSQREQLLLLLCGVVVALTGLWVLLWQPVMAARSSSEARLAYAAETLDEVNSLAAELEYLRQSVVADNELSGAAQSLPQMLDTLSARIGIVAASLEPAADNRSVGVRFDGVAMSDLLSWLAELDSYAGTQIEQMTITPVSNTSPAGNQAVNTTLRVRSLR